jgi:hypothetical protein
MMIYDSSTQFKLFSIKIIYLNILTFSQIFQAESVRDAAWGCDWVGTPVPFQRCLAFIIATTNMEFTLTAGKFVPVSNATMMNVSGSTHRIFILCEGTQLGR